MNAPVIALQGVSVAYGGRLALRALSVAIDAGALVAVAGPNGAGKSTLLQVIAGGIRPLQGTVTRPPQLSVLPQLAEGRRDFPLTALQVVATGFWPSLGNGAPITKVRQARARAALHEVGLQGLEDRQAGALSGGQFQRLLFARLIVEDAPVILLDEPFTGVDRGTVATLLQLILGWHREGRTILCVLHDEALIAKHFPATLLLAQDDQNGGTARLAATGALIAEGVLGQLGAVA